MSFVLQSKLRTLGKIVWNSAVKRGLYYTDSNRKFLVLMYHGVDRVGCRRYNDRFFSIADFERQILLLKKYTNILSHEEFVNQSFSDDRLNVVITFDDGYENNYHYVLPILEKMGVHAYFFVTGVHNESVPILWADAVDIVARSARRGATVVVDDISFQLTNGKFVALHNGEDLKHFIKKSNRAGGILKQTLVADLLGIFDFTSLPEFSDYWKLMNNEQIFEAASSPMVTIGSHGYYHNNLGSLSLQDSIQEVLLSKRHLEGITGKLVDSIAFPDGSYSIELSEALYEEGFNSQFVVNHRYSDYQTPKFVCDRLGLYPFQGNPNEILYQILKN